MLLLSPHREEQEEAGLSLVEIVVVVATLAIILSISLLCFGRASASYQLKSKAQNIAWQIERARSIAIKRNQRLTLAFNSQSGTLGLACADCDEAKTELPPYTVPADVHLSSSPTLTISGNGTISATTDSLTVSDGGGRQIVITISNSGRVTVGDVTAG